MGKQTEISLKGETKYSELELQILQYLYEHPDFQTGFMHLTNAFRPENPPEYMTPAGEEAYVEERRRAVGEILYAVETLIKDKLAKGKRQVYMGQLQYADLDLTPTGEAYAIEQKRSGITVVLEHIREDE